MQSSKPCPQRRKTLKRSDAICNTTFEDAIDNSPTTIDIIDYVHNNKKEKITVIVNLLSDEMLSGQHHDSDEQIVGNEKANHRNVKDNSSNENLIEFPPEVDWVKKKDIEHIQSPLLKIEGRATYEPKTQIGNDNTFESLHKENTAKIEKKGKLFQLSPKTLIFRDNISY